MNRALALVLILLVVAGVVLLGSRHLISPSRDVERTGADRPTAPARTHDAADPVLLGHTSGRAAPKAASPAGPASAGAVRLTHTFLGSVQAGEDHEPIAGAEVVILVPRAGSGLLSSAREIGRSETSADGTYEFEAALPKGSGPFWTEFRAPWRTVRRMRLDLGRLTHRARVQLARAGRIEGRVVREDGSAAAGVRVWYERWRRSPRYRGGWPSHEPRPTVSRRDGSFRLDGVWMGRPVVVHAGRPYGPQGASRPVHVEPAAPEVRDVEVRIAMPGEVSGRLLRPDGSPWKEVQVALASHELSAARAQLTQHYLDEQGGFEFVVVPAGTYALELVLPGCRHPLVFRADVRVPAGGSVDLGDVVHGLKQVVSGRLTKAYADEGDLEGTRLRLWSGSSWHETEAREDGTFLFPVVGPGRWWLDVAEDQYGTRGPVPVRAGATGLVVEVFDADAGLTLAVRGAHGEMLEGRRLLHLVPHGRPVARTSRLLEGSAAEPITSDAIPPGTYDLLLRVSDHALWRRDGVELASGEMLRLEARLRRAPRLRRRVLDEHGTPVEDAHVLLLDDRLHPGGPVLPDGGFREMAEVSVDAEGVFEVPVAHPDLTIMIGDHTCWRYQSLVRDLPSGDLVLPPTVSVRGQLVAASGAGVPDVCFTLDTTGPPELGGLSGANGVFVLDHVFPGRWTLRVSNHGGRVIREVSFEVGSADVDLGQIRVTDR